MPAYATEYSANVIDWLRQLAQLTRAFRVEAVISAHRPDPAQERDYRVYVVPQNPAGTLPLCFNIAVKARLNPQIAWEALARIRAASAEGTPALCCPAISPRVADMCRQAGVSYFDGNGNAHLAAPGFLLHVEGRPRRPKTPRMENGVDPFAPKSSRIARVLLGSPGALWQVQTLARLAQISIGLASRVKDALLYQRFLEAADGRLRLVRPRELLENWAGQYRPPATPIPLGLTGTPSEVEKRIVRWSADHGVQCALTGFSGAGRIAPALRCEHSSVYLLMDPAVSLLDNLVTDLGAQRGAAGSNVSLWPTLDPAVFFAARPIDGAPVVSPLQLYLDLKGQTGRGPEAAEEIFAQAIAPTFAHGGAAEEATPRAFNAG